MTRLANVASAAVIGLAALTAPAWSQGSSPPAGESSAPHATPKSDGGVAGDGLAAPAEAESKARAGKDGGAPVPGPAGCPLLNRKLELIV